MRYSVAMVMLVPTLAAMMMTGTVSPAARFDSGASVSVAIRARIIRSARVGVDRMPPLPQMMPRRTTVSAADGRLVPALVYDFE